MTTQALNQCKTINLCFWDAVPNFGDTLSPYLITKITGCKVKHASFKDKDKLVAIGSLIRTSTLFSQSHIWGSGSLTSDPFRKIPFYSIHKHVQNWYKRSFKQSIIYALRGPLTESICEKAGFKVPRVYGDPAILIPRFYQPKPLTADKHKIGLVLHHTQSNQLKNIDYFVKRQKESFESFANRALSPSYS